LKHAEVEIESVRKEVARTERLRLAVVDKCAEVDDKRAKADERRDQLKAAIAATVRIFLSG